MHPEASRADAARKARDPYNGGMIATEDLRRHLLTHLRQLRAAGVEWLPPAPAIDILPPKASPAPLVSTMSADVSAFDIAAENVAGASDLTLDERRMALTT